MPVGRSAGAIVFRGPFYLLLHYQSGHWDFPKGGIEKGEKTEETVRREVREETGIANLEFIPGFKKTIHFVYQHQGDLVNKWVAYLLAETRQAEVKISFEHQGFAWLGFAEAIERVTFKNAKEVLRAAEDYLKLRGYAA